MAPRCPSRPGTAHGASPWSSARKTGRGQQMRWFFLVVLVALAAGVEALIVGDGSHHLADQITGAIVFAIFWFALLMYWTAGCFLKAAAQERGLELANSILLLSVAIYFILLGRDVLISSGCAYSLLNETDIAWLRELANITGYLQEWMVQRSGLFLLFCRWSVFVAYA